MTRRKPKTANVGSKTKPELVKELTKANKLVAAQEITIQKLLKKIDELEQSTAKNVPIIGANDAVDEVTIAEIQLQKLSTIAAQRQFTSEEARLFETYSKVIQQDKRLNQGKKTETRPFRDVTPKKLLSIANIDIPEAGDE